MKIAYLIMAHNTPKQLTRLISSLQSEHSTFYIHIDKKSSEKFDIPKMNNVHILKKRIPVFWGGFSQVEASLELLKEATKHGSHDYYVLLSGSSYPVKSTHYINEFFSKYNGYEFIDLYPMPLFDKNFDRIDYFFLEGDTNKYINFLYAKINILIKSLKIKRTYPTKYSEFKKLAGANWWALTHYCVEYILNFLKENKEYIKFYKNTLCPDEMFFQTIIGNSPFSKNIMNNIVYADWSGSEKPSYINELHMNILKNESVPVPFGDKRQFLLFARKFNDGNTEIINKIDSTLRI